MKKIILMSLLVSAASHADWFYYKGMYDVLGQYIGSYPSVHYSDYERCNTARSYDSGAVSSCIFVGDIYSPCGSSWACPGPQIPEVDIIPTPLPNCTFVDC